MRIYVLEPREKRQESLETELRGAGLDPMFVDEEVFGTLLGPLKQPGLTSRGVLIGETERTPDYVRTLRREGCANPIMVMRDFRNSKDTSALLDLGVDDVLIAPIKGGEVMSRVNSVVRRLHGHAADSVIVGELTAYFDGRDPVVSGHSIKLSKREHAIFQHLALNTNRVISKDAIYDAVYGMSADQPFDKVIDVYICKIRKKISLAAKSGYQYIETIRGRGYKLRPPEHFEQANLGAAMAMPSSRHMQGPLPLHVVHKA
ncbi:MAG: response regulator transcription factor [Shimia sp.]|nr:response regulator transcription factor [Shimia sp.]